MGWGWGGGGGGTKFHDNLTHTRLCWKHSLPPEAQTHPQGISISHRDSQAVVGKATVGTQAFLCLYSCSLYQITVAPSTNCQAHSGFCFAVPGSSACWLVIMIFTSDILIYILLHYCKDEISSIYFVYWLRVVFLDEFLFQALCLFFQWDALHISWTSGNDLVTLFI